VLPIGSFSFPFLQLFFSLSVFFEEVTIAPPLMTFSFCLAAVGPLFKDFPGVSPFGVAFFFFFCFPFLR